MRMLRTMVLGSIVLSFVAACGDEAELLAHKAHKAQIDAMERSSVEMASTLTNATVVTHDPNSLIKQHGTQVEFHASNGKSFLWYPGNRRIVFGEWKVREVAPRNSRDRIIVNGEWVHDPSKPLNVEVCYRYGYNTYNPVTRQMGGEWQCSRPYYGESEFLVGDPFELGSGEVPFVIPDKDRYFPEHLAVLNGDDPNGIIHKF